MYLCFWDFDLLSPGDFWEFLSFLDFFQLWRLITDNDKSCTPNFLFECVPWMDNCKKKVENPYTIPVVWRYLSPKSSKKQYFEHFKGFIFFNTKNNSCFLFAFLFVYNKASSKMQKNICILLGLDRYSSLKIDILKIYHG